MTRHDAQAALPEITTVGQQRIYDAKVLIVGVGALGSTTAELLCRAGVRNITLYDFDIVEESNLQRQSLYTTSDVGRLKVEAAKEHLITIDPMCLVATKAEAFSPKTAVTDYDVIIDGTDSLQARFLLNDAAKHAGKPLVIGAASGTSGMVFVARSDVCWQCIASGKEATDDCDTGVLNTATHTIAGIQATAALQIILGHMPKQLLEIDLWSMEMRRITVKRNEDCLACKGSYEYLHALFNLRFCTGRQKLVATPNIPHIVDLDAIRAKHSVMKDYGTAIIISLGEGSVLLHQHGAMEFTNVNDEIAKKFAKEIL